MKDEKSYYSIGEAAKAAGMTEETLRHYDRVGLVKPSKRDEWTNYRYYTEQDVVRLNTVYALRQMELPLKKIKEVLAYDDLRKIVDFLTEAEQTADKKIAALQYSKSKIQAAKRDYARKLQTERRTEQAFVQRLPARVIMLSDEAEKPALDDLWNYLGRFYSQIEPSRREQFAFEDLAGLYTEGGRSRLFAVCLRHGEARRPDHAAGGQLSVRRLHGGRTKRNALPAAAEGGGGLRRLAPLYAANHSHFRHSEMELPASGPARSRRRYALKKAAEPCALPANFSFFLFQPKTSYSRRRNVRSAAKPSRPRTQSRIRHLRFSASRSRSATAATAFSNASAFCSRSASVSR